MTQDFEPRHGEWWHPANPTARTPGTLTLLADHRSQLEILGQLPSLHGTDSATVYGETYDGERVTLHHAVTVRGSAFPGSSQNRYSVIESGRTYIGVWFDAPGAVAFTYLGAQIGGLVDWLRAGDFLSQEWTPDEKAVTIQSSKDMASDCSATVDGFDFRAMSFSPWFAGSTFREIRLAQTAAVRIASESARPINDFLELLHDFQSLLWLLFLRPAEIHSLSGECDSAGRRVVSGKVIKVPVTIYIAGLTNMTESDRSSYPLITGNQLAPTFEEVLSKWVRARRHMPAIYQLFFLPLYGHPLYRENRFLGLVQATEAYARLHDPSEYMAQDDWMSGPYNALIAAIPSSTSRAHRESLKARLRYAHLYSFRKLLASLVDGTPLVRDRLIRCPGVFAADVALLRNYHVHVAGELEPLVAEVPPLDHISDYLEILLHVRLLRDLGFDDEVLSTALFGGPYFRSRIEFRLTHYWAPLQRQYRRSSPSK